MKAIDYAISKERIDGSLIPLKLREIMNISVNDPLEIYTDKETIILKKCVRKCILCNGTNNVLEYKGKVICRDCINALK